MDFGFIFSFPSLLLLLAIALLSIIYLVARLLPKPKIDIKGKYVLITGCDTGFGRATAIELDRMGAYVLATCLTNEGEKSLKSVTSDKLKTFQMDVTNSKHIKHVYEEIKKETSLGEMTNKFSNNNNNNNNLYYYTFLPLTLHFFKAIKGEKK